MGAIDRRLAAIMVADMEQYSRLMHEDEPGTVLAWQETREEVIKPTIASHSGNILKNMGDGFVAEFSTVSGVDIFKGNVFQFYMIRTIKH